MPSFVTWVCGFAGWRRRGVAVLAGAASVLAMAPFHVWPVLFLTLPVLVWLIDGAIAVREAPVGGGRFRRLMAGPSARAAGVAWWFGFGYFLAGLFWIGEAFLVEAETFAVLLPFAVTLMPAGLALFWAGAAAAATLAWRPGLERVLALAIAVSIAEWLRGHVLSGFPWNVLGYALTYPLMLMQSAAGLGIYSLTLLAVAIFAAPAVLYVDHGGGNAGRLAPASRLLGVVIAAVVLAGLAGWGAIRLGSAGLADSHPSKIKVRLVQPSIPQREKWRPENQSGIFRDHIGLSLHDATGRNDGAEGVQLIVWPEAAMPFLPLGTPAALTSIGRMLPEGAYLLSGALRLDEPEPGARDARRRVYNSLLAFGADGRLAAAYDKIHLVPFGEYLPLQSLLEAIGLEQLSRLRGGFAAGARPRPLLALPGLPLLGPLVCYEAIFPGTIVQGAGRPAALINITNDGWFGNTTGPRQHLHQARVRAVEEGLPLLRAANNGISAVIDAQGRIVARLELDAIGVIDALLPAALAPPLYARFGDWVFAGLLLATIVVLGWLRRRGASAAVRSAAAMRNATLTFAQPRSGGRDPILMKQSN